MDLTPEDIDALIRDATWRCGGASGAALRAEAIRVLRAHADVAYPVVLERARTQPTPELLALLGALEPRSPPEP